MSPEQPQNDNVYPLRRDEALGAAEPPGGRLTGGNGGGSFDGMEPRIAKLETHVEYLRRDMTDLKSVTETVRKDVTELRVQVAGMAERMATKGFMVASWITMISAITALIAFQQQIQKFFHP